MTGFFLSFSVWETDANRMSYPQIPEDVRRFVLTSVPSVPFLESLLLLRADPDQRWDSALLASRLYISDRVAGELLEDLRTAGMARRCDAPHTHCYCYGPVSELLRDKIDLLADVYVSQLVEVTHLIHSTLERKAQQFADAFRLRKDT
ncbi:hypothetical protein AB2N08_01855 [Massilia aurea]|uniref:hypothetical protein n=1 Tax=Massilia aurea TaxID=373040 RepID=UPI003462223F